MVNASTQNEEHGLKALMSDMGRNTRITVEEEAVLAERIQQGDVQARNELVEANMAFVVYIAKRYAGRGLPLLDLIQEGSVGAMTAAKKFDPSRGKYSTYAGWWIHQAVQRALISTGSSIRMPVHVAEDLKALRKAQARHSVSMGGLPNAEWLVEELGWPVQKVRRMLAAQSLKRCSIDDPLDGEGSVDTFKDRLPCGNPLPDETVDKHHREIAAVDCLSVLPSHYEAILVMRYGLDNDEPMTLEAIGNIVGVTRERIRQIEVAALEKLRAHPSVKELR